MLQYVAGVRTAAFVTVYAQIYILVFFMFSIFVVPKDVVKTAVVARKDTPSCSQHVSFSQFLVNSPKLKNVYLRCDRLDRTDDFDAFELLGQHIRKKVQTGHHHIRALCARYQVLIYCNCVMSNRHLTEPTVRKKAAT